MAYLTMAAIQAALADNSTGLITAVVDQNVAFSLGDMIGGFESVRQQYGLTGNNSTADWNALASGLNSSSKLVWPRFAPQLNTSSKDLTQEVYWEGAGICYAFAGTMPTLNANSAGSGAIVFTPHSAVIWRNIRFTNGKVWLDLGGTTEEIPIIWLEGIYADNISCLLRDGSISSNLTRKIDKLIFRNNNLINSDRGLFLNGNGASRAWIEGNHVTGCTRFGIMNTPASPNPANNGFADFVMVRNNLVEGLSYSGANANDFIFGGRYHSIIGNIAANAVYNGNPDQTNFESYYLKTQGCAVVGNLSVNGGSGQGMFALKGIGRVNSDSSPPGYDYTLVGNVGILTSGSQYHQPGIWLQTQDANVGHNVLDGFTGYAWHVNNNAGDVSQRSYNLSVKDNLFTAGPFGGGGISEGGHTNIQSVGNTYRGLGSSTGGQSFGVRYDSLSLGDMVNYRVENETIYGLIEANAGRFDCIHIRPRGTDSALALRITGNTIDLTGCPDISNVFGISFDDTGPIVNCIVDKNIFVGFSGTTKMIRNITSSRTDTVTILDNPGFTNDTTGTGTITTGTASVTISHGMPQPSHMDPTPAPTDIEIRATSVLSGASQLRIANITATTFDLVADSAVTVSNFTFAWRCRKTKWTFN